MQTHIPPPPLPYLLTRFVIVGAMNFHFLTEIPQRIRLLLLFFKLLAGRTWYTAFCSR